MTAQPSGRNNEPQSRESIPTDEHQRGIRLVPVRLFASDEIVFINPEKIVSVSQFHKTTRIILEAGAPMDVHASVEQMVDSLLGRH
jgi:hypothetical protein